MKKVSYSNYILVEISSFLSFVVSIFPSCAFLYMTDKKLHKIYHHIIIKRETLIDKAS